MRFVDNLLYSLGSVELCVGTISRLITTQYVPLAS